MIQLFWKNSAGLMVGWNSWKTYRNRMVLDLTPGTPAVLGGTHGAYGPNTPPAWRLENPNPLESRTIHPCIMPC
jgi:hypothetical protein